MGLSAEGEQVPEEPGLKVTKKAIEKIVKEDDELADRVKRFANTVMDRAEYLLLHGNPYMQANLIRSLMPALSRGLQSKQESDEIATMRAEFRELTEEMRSGSSEDLDVDREVPAAPTSVAYPDERPASSPIQSELGTA